MSELRFIHVGRVGACVADDDESVECGAPADSAVLRVEKGTFGYLDGSDYRMNASQRLTCEMTVSNGVVVWDLNGISGRAWKTQSVKTSAR